MQTLCSGEHAMQDFDPVCTISTHGNSCHKGSREVTIVYIENSQIPVHRVKKRDELLYLLVFWLDEGLASIY